MSGEVYFVVDVEVDEINLVVVGASVIGSYLIKSVVFIESSDKSVDVADGRFSITVAGYGEVVANHCAASHEQVGRIVYFDGVCGIVLISTEEGGPFDG